MNTNPKDAVGVRKAGMSCVPAEVLLELGLAMQEGARKYGRHNYRIAGIRASVYYDAAMRHLMAWFEGEDIDPESGLSHLTKAMACLVVMCDGIHNNCWVDDRPPSLRDGWQSDLNKKASDLIDRWPDAKEPYVKDDRYLGSKLLQATDPIPPTLGEPDYSKAGTITWIDQLPDPRVQFSAVGSPEYLKWIGEQETVERET